MCRVVADLLPCSPAAFAFVKEDSPAVACSLQSSRLTGYLPVRPGMLADQLRGGKVDRPAVFQSCWCC